MNQLPWCAKCGQTKDSTLVHDKKRTEELNQYVQERKSKLLNEVLPPIDFHEFEACYAAKDVLERDKRLADALNDFAELNDLWDFPLSSKIEDVIKELRGEKT